MKHIPHVKKRLSERAGIVSANYAEIVDLALDFGEHIMYNKGGDVYKCKYHGKTIYPVITFDGKLITVLSEDMVRRNINEARR